MRLLVLTACVAVLSVACRVEAPERSQAEERAQSTGYRGILLPDAEPRHPPVIDDNPMYIRDYAKCVLCWRCVQVCAEDAQYTYAINFTGRGKTETWRRTSGHGAECFRRQSPLNFKGEDKYVRH